MQRRLGLFVTVFILGLTLVFAVVPVHAQSASMSADAHHRGMAAARDGAMMPMAMDGCRQMMAASMMPMGPDQNDPRMMSHMMQMRGEMMKAMGEIMMKHGKMMQGGATN